MFDFKKTYQLPFKIYIPNYIQAHIEEVSQLKRFFKFFRRFLYVILMRQKNLEVFTILPQNRKILWINISAPSLGDSLMDLSSRAMLKGRRVDLFTDVKNYQLYLNDEYFTNVYTKIKEVKKIKYDLVIIDSYSSRSINIKSKIAPKTLFAGIFGYFNGPEVNRILFSFHKMNLLLGSLKNENEINILAKNSISISTKDQNIVDDIVPKKYITIVLGGEWNFKIYKNWDKVIGQLIVNDKELRIIFIGSANAKNISNELLKKYPRHNFLNFVERLSFNQSVEVARRSEVLLCCDGGLMHAANAVSVNSVALFARLTPEMLTTNYTNSFNLFDSDNVNNIPVDDILNKYYEASSFVDNHPQSE